MFSLVVAVDRNNNIGRNGKIPWHCPEDLKHFKNLTSGGVVIMGRKTYESIGRPLPNRINYVISKTLETRDVSVFKDPWDLIRHCQKHHVGTPMFVIGGGQIYDWFLDNQLISDLHVTKICQSHENCDTKFSFPRGLEFNQSHYLSADAIYEKYVIANPSETAFLKLVKNILTYGNLKLDRTQVGTKSVFGRQLRFDLSNNIFPLMTTRKMFLRGIFEELMMFIRGQTDNQILEDKKIMVWRANTTRQFLDARGLTHLPVGDMGPSYGFLFRHFGAKYKTCKDDYKGQGVDQLANVIKTLRVNPADRRMIISLWDPVNLDNCPLPPCLYNYQFYVSNGELSCMMTQRSSDIVVAGGWNIATGALLTILIASVCDLTPGELIWNLGDTHIYNNLTTAAETQVIRKPTPYPKLFLNKKENIEDYEFSDLELLGYAPQPAIETVMNA